MPPVTTPLNSPTTDRLLPSADSPRSRGGPGGRTPDPASIARDRAQLSLAPVDNRRILALFHPHRGRIALVVAVIVASSVIALSQPFLVKHVIDVALPTQDVALLVECVLAMIAIAAVTAVLGVLQTWLATGVGQQIMHRLRAGLFTHLQRQSLDFFTRTRTGEVQSRLTNDVGGMQQVVTSTATQVAANLTTVVGAAVAMIALSWRLSLLSLLVIPPAIWLSRQVARMRYRVTTLRQRALADLNVQIEEGLSVGGTLLTKTLGAAERNGRQFADTSGSLAALAVSAQLAGRWRMATMNVIFAVIPALLYLAAGLPATSGGMTIGTLVAFVGLQATLFRPLSSLLNVGVEITASRALFSRIFEYLDLPVEIADPPRPVALDHPRGEVRFDQVGFHYGDQGRAALSEVDLVVPAGGSLALVGETGSGKSTLARMVARLHDPTSGRITLDGVDLRDLRLERVSDLVGVVSQDTYLLHASVRDNLLIARPEATQAEIESACRIARVHEVIERLPDGYDEIIGSRGHRLSGGEQQRLAIARTILRDPLVLVLDEATSALDNETERLVQEGLDGLRRGRTTITVAHRLSTVRDADLIAVLDRGRVVETGTHEELLLRGGRYADLVRHGLERTAA